MLGSPLWLLGGLLLSLWQTVSLVLLVGKMGSGNVGGIWLRSIGGYGLRYLLTGLVLTLALRQSLASGLMAFAGLWLGRWVTVYLGKSGRINWSAFS